MVCPPRADGNLLLVAVILCLCCALVTCKIMKGKWMQSIFDQMKADFLWYASKEGNPETMNCREFREYLKVKKLYYIEDNKDLDIVEKTLSAMDLDKDGELNYKEVFHFHKQCTT